MFIQPALEHPNSTGRASITRHWRSGRGQIRCRCICAAGLRSDSFASGESFLRRAFHTDVVGATVLCPTATPQGSRVPWGRVKAERLARPGRGVCHPGAEQAREPSRRGLLRVISPLRSLGRDLNEQGVITRLTPASARARLFPALYD